MKLNRTLLVSLLLTASLALSCAVEPDEDSDIVYDHVMDAWMRVNYPAVKPYGTHGAYVLQMDKGDGVSIGDSAYIKVHYTKSMLDGTIVETNEEDLAKQMGNYAVSSNYAGNTWRLTQGYVPDALEEVIRSMRSGGRATIALPKSASGHNASMYDAFTSSEESNNYIFDLAIDTVINDIISYQDQQMQEWFRTRYGIQDTVADHLFFKKLVEKTADSDTISEGASINVRYIGRLMDGQVFDTNIADTAKFYRIWSGDKGYSALSVTFYKEDDDKFSSDNNFVSGFGQAIQRMNYGETAVALFNSELGYGENGSNPSIPEYSPLFFWIYIEPSDD